ncbi:MAG: hypothetical protein M1383_04875 [Patescibacteria group bacterium]|nr:hypothetical protein [Patescibacteria group bacterium]
MVLYIDTTDFGKITFAATDGKKLWKKSCKIDPHKSHETLGCLEKFFKAGKFSRSQVKKIVVNKGPGSYTGTRIGVTIAQALGFAWGVPVKFLPKDKMPAL